jgi:hypothetical protein
MKIKFSALIIIAMLCSCSNDDDCVTQATLVGEWKLIQMSGSIPDSETTGSDMEWQESYRFFEDGNFLKTRETEGSVEELTGTYSFNEDPRSLELTYGKESQIIGSCQSDLKENLFFSSNNVLSSTWNQCDGPSLDYEKI